MSEIDLKEVLIPFRKKDILPNPTSAFTTIKNTFFELEIPYSHLLLFSSVEYENGVFSIRKALTLPYFHTIGANGKSVFIKKNGVKRLVVDFIFEYQIEERLEHYGHLLGTYLLMAETVLNDS